jgi:5-bromo-4-chloroindolyl phosphate hydrolysis protein
MSTYNGWRNRETWLIMLWYAPLTKTDIKWIREDFEEQLQSIPTLFREFIDKNIIDWDGLRDALEDEEDV